MCLYTVQEIHVYTHRLTMHFNNVLRASLMMQSVNVLCHHGNIPALTSQSALKVSYSLVTSVRYLTQMISHMYYNYVHCMYTSSIGHLSQAQTA